MKSQQAMKIEWMDSGKEPQCPPNPDYPSGIDIRLAEGVSGCLVPLPYPAKRCGAYVITCSRCGAYAAVSTAGRPDDPRSVEIPCLMRRLDG